MISTQLIWGRAGKYFDKKAGHGTQASSIKVEINVLTIFSSEVSLEEINTIQSSNTVNTSIIQ